MTDLIFFPYTVEKIIAKCVQKFSNELGAGMAISNLAYAEAWTCFVKWCKTQLDLDRTVTLPSFANITSKSSKNDEKEKIIYVILNENFLIQNNLNLKIDPVEIKAPTVKVSFPSIAKLSDLDKTVLSTAVNNIIIEISEVLASQNNIELDMGQLGKLLLKDKTIQFVPSLKNKANIAQNRPTVQGLMGFSNKKHNLSPIKMNDLSQSALQSPQTIEKYGILPQKDVKLFATPEKPSVFPNPSPSLFFKTFMKPSSPTRRFYRPDQIPLKPEMLGAGTDPLAKNQDFSILAGNAKDLMNSQFKKPPFAKIRFPPILDKFSRTLAAPICGQKFNLGVSSRIGSNYTEEARRLYIDLEGKCIRVAKLRESKVNFTANEDLLRECADLDEELKVVVGRSQDPELIQKLKAKKVCYERYHAYIQNEITIDNVAVIKPVWITDILDLIPADFQYLEKSFVEGLIDKMLNEINKDYYDSVRKGILDYVLKDEEERLRIGIMQLFDEVLDYGNNIYKGLEPDSLWKEHINFSREEINQNLVICNNATLKIMKIWKKYETMHFLFYPLKKDQPVTIQFYIKLQEDRINEVKTLLTSEWLKEVTDIYHEELSQMKKNKKQALIFFESNATLMSNQVRSLVTESLQLYREFFQRFRKRTYLPPLRIVEMEKDPKGGIEEVFLVIKLKDEDGYISFTDSLEFVRSELIRIIQMVVETSHCFQRPESTWSRGEKTYLTKVPLDDQIVEETTNEIDEIIENNIRNIENVVNIFNQYSFLLNEMDKVVDFCNQKHERKDYQAEILKYQKISEEVNKIIPFFVRMNMILIDGIDVKKNFLSICDEIKSKLFTSIHGLITRKILTINNDISGLRDSISAKVESEKQLVELEKNVELIRMKRHKEILNEFKDTIRWLMLLYEYPFQPEDEVRQIHLCSEQVHGLITNVDKEENRLKKERDGLDSKLRKTRDEFIQNIEILANEIEALRIEYTEKFQSADANKRIELLDNRLKRYLEEKNDINQKEDLIIGSQTEFPRLEDAKNNLQPYQELWKLIKDWTTNEKAWQREVSIYKLNPEVIEKETKEMFKTANTLNFRLKDIANPAKLCGEILKDIKAFQVHLPLIKIFCNQGLKDRHWDEISGIIAQNTGIKGFQVKPDKEILLKKLIDLEIYKFVDLLDEISDSATKEFNIEKILNKMLEDWEPIICEIKIWKDTGTYVVSGNTIDEIQTILDDQTVKTQTMKGSPYAKIFEQRISEWETWLIYTWNLIEYWIKVQQVWLYLEPIFSSPDIIKHLATEAKLFKDVDTNWRTMMNKINATPKVLEFTKNKKLLDLLKECHSKLEEVQKGLNAYLEEKRNNFPRFYFLSNDELLEILSETKDPLRVQPHLKKCFEGIQKLKFDEEKKIMGMFSSEGEYVPFLTPIDTNEHLGKVDEWLLITERFMQDAIRNVVHTAFNEYLSMSRDAWVLKRCGQAVLCINMVYWTMMTEKAMREKGADGVEEYAARCTDLLNDVVKLTRTEIDSLDRCTIEALIVLDVHNRDVVQALAQRRIERISDFDWQAQLRYYWLENSCKVRIINAELPYNFEYLGNSSRLVITPLTDRCYRTLCGALHLNYGGAPEGPAGTGKTETVKDLAKALARQCVVFNCSDGLDYQAMGKFFKGLASSGAWSCFDEFNRIELEVLSVVAQQILTIQIARGKNLEKFNFEGAEIRLISTCNVFITMNPGYAGRSELPDNLKALFRSVAMMVPDYAMIAEISLYSFGFSNARNLARKIVTTYKLCSEQLSSQHHYDYGMRAVKSVLTAGGNLKRKFPNEDENILMLRAINDVNLAKFLAFDLPLFEGITSDLFPSVQLPKIDYSAMEECIENQLKKANLTKIDYFTGKIIQLYEMILVRHGLMVVGLPFSGKTSAIKILAAALTELNEKKLMDEKKVLLTTINPKSISMKQLYGWNDEVTHEWTDGVLAIKYRAFAKNEEDERKWLVFDGPIDAVWIENMNTVLDDNKKLCLNSGEIIAMSKGMNLLFEPMDLEAASPATVSRCGMVYMEPSRMGWHPLFESWKKTLPRFFKDEDKNEIDLLFEWSLEPILDELRRRGQEISPSQNQNLIMSLMRIYRCCLQIFDEEQYYTKIDIKNKLNLLDQFFVFSCIWSLGGSATTDYRKSMSMLMKRHFGGDMASPPDGKKKKIILPDSGLLYDYKYTLKGPSSFEGEWISWVNFIDLGEVIPKNIQPQEILVKTSDTIRYSFLLQMNILNEIPTLFCGPTGTGKSVYIKNLLMNGLEKEKFKTTEVGFSAQTTSMQTQDIIDNNLDRRKKKGVFGPKSGKAIIFVDDLNMPSKEKWGAQPPIELLRQMLDQGGWYDFKDKERPFKNLVDIIFVGAMGPPGGGRTFITPRLLRHLNLVSLAQFDDDTLNRIFNTILHWYFGSFGFNQEVIKTENKIVLSTLDIYKHVIEKLLPTPMKSHYLFNLRDFAKVIMGICMSDKDKLQNQDQVVRLWTHEVLRVFSDRLISEDDRLVILNYIRENVVRSRFGLNFDTVFGHLDRPHGDVAKDGKINSLDEIRGLMFTDCMTPAGMPKRFYEEILDENKLHSSIEQSLENYNVISDKPMDLVLFSFAIEHLLIIARILKQPQGNALLVGVGGSGRQSLTRLAAKISDYEVFQIEITRTYGKTEWRDDMKKILKQAGGKFVNTVFLLTDSQIKDESFIEDVNNLLNTGEIPNIYPPDEKAEVMELVRAQARSEGKALDGTPAQLFAYFVDQCKKQLHIVLCFSPIGDAFRGRVRMFPSLVNCCTIDWFNEWPQDALVSVARRFLTSVEMNSDVKESCVEMVQYFHESTIKYAVKFYSELQRKYYVTPTSYIELITTFRNLLSEKRKEILFQRNKYENGYEKIITTEKKVEEMQVNLIQLQPKLKIAAEETEKKMKEVAEQKMQADVLKEAISKEEAVVQIAVNEAQTIKDDCQADLDEAMPALNAAEEALKTLEQNKANLDTIRRLPNPSNPIKYTVQALCYLMYPNPTEKKRDPVTLKNEVDYWAASQKLMNDTDFVKKLFTFDREDIKEENILKLGKFLNDPLYKDFIQPETVANASRACECLINWINGIYKYYFINKKVRPKKQKLKESEDKVNELQGRLTEKQKELKAANDKVERLNSDLMITKRNKEKLENEYAECSKQLERAKKLIENLGGEKGRWADLAVQLKEFYQNLTGDILISAGMIAYLGAFTSVFRNEICSDWVSNCVNRKIPSSEVFNLAKVLGDAVKIREWNINGLPSDSFSVENGIIISKARRWPLCIDPQNQANKWIKKMESTSTRKISIIKLSDANFIRTLENSIIFGQPVLLENVGEELDPILEPILLKQTYQKGSTMYMKLGSEPIEYNSNFFFYITTKLRNPHYLPEISTKVTLLNFMITYEGLNDQLLGILVKKERPDLEQEKERLITEGAKNKKQLQEIEDKILAVLSSDKNILLDEEAINILTASKLMSNEIKEKQTVAEVTEKNIDTARGNYQSVSQEASCLFFSIMDLANLDPMYQYSLVYYIELFTQAIIKSKKSEDLNERLENLKKYFLYSLYCNICRSLFEKDKLTFSFILATRLLEFKGLLTTEEMKFLLTGGLALDENMPKKPDEAWISQKSWGEIFRLSKFEVFATFVKDFKEKINEWKAFYDDDQPQNRAYPAPYHENLNHFQKLMVMRTLRPDRIIPAMQEFIKEKLGSEFIDPPPFNLAEIFKDSSAYSPLIFVLSPGSDPFASLDSFAKSMRKNINPISLGQGQGPYAQRMIEDALINGSWVVLQNCHLAVSWMPTLEKICDEFSPDPTKTNSEFRLWLTSYPSTAFPTSILQNGVKMTNEPPKGLKANLKGSYLIDPINNAEFFNGCKQNNVFKRLLFGLCFFHAVIQERRKYGALGWNIAYEFNESDLRICVRQLKMFLDENENEIPFEALKYLTAECNYGGRVTDDKDRRLINTLLEDYYNDQFATDPTHLFTPNPVYRVPGDIHSYDQYIDFIQTLPLNTPPEVFGFHTNANITKDINETNMAFDAVLLCSSQGEKVEAGSGTNTLEEICRKIYDEFPPAFNMEEATKKYDVQYNESMNTVLTQELTRFNKLIKAIRSSLQDIRKAIKGELIMSPAMEKAANSLSIGKVPDMWMSASYPSLKGLGSYITDLKLRIAGFKKWLDEGSPIVFWISGLYFTQSFLTGVLQNYARKYHIPIDEIVFDFEFIKGQVTEKPVDGAYVDGLFIEGARWNEEKMKLDESEPKVLFDKCPIILLKPVHFKKVSEYKNYDCPVYKTSVRRGVLSTTGHSTNFVMFIRIPIEHEDRHWIKRGVALLTQLDD